MTTLTKATPNVVVIGIGIAATILSAGYGFLDEDGRIGPGFLPAVAAALMALFAVVNLVTGRTSPGHTVERIVESRIPGIETAAPTDPVTGSHTPDHMVIHQDPATTQGPSTDDVPDDGVDIHGRSQRQRDRMLRNVVGIVILTVLLVPVLGFMVAFALMLVVVAVVVERRRIVPSLIVSFITLAVTYAVFVLFLRVPLPQGILGI